MNLKIMIKKQETILKNNEKISFILARKDEKTKINKKNMKKRGKIHQMFIQC